MRKARSLRSSTKWMLRIMPTRCSRRLERSSMKLIALGAMLAAFLMQSDCSKSTPPAAANNANAANAVKKIEKDADVPRISVVDAKKAFDDGTAVIVDARGESAYQAEHIASSINIPFGMKNDFSSLPKGKKII